MSKYIEDLVAAGGMFVLESQPISEVKSVSRPNVLYEEHWKPGTEERVVDFPQFENLPVNAGFSWGKAGREIMVDANAFQELRDGKPRKAEAVVTSFLKTIDANFRREDVVRIYPQLRNGEIPQPEVLEILPEHIERNHERLEGAAAAAGRNIATGADFVYTRMKNIPLVALPADCPSAVVYAKGKHGEDIIGIAHWGRDEIERMLPAKSVARLIGDDCKIEDIYISITPGISQANYYIKEADAPQLLPNIEVWGSRVEKGIGRKKERSWDKYEERLYLDLVGRITDQIHAFRIPGENLQIYDIDTYRAALRGETYSHRLAIEERIPEMDGRFILAAQLKD